jgi:membrane-associated PAP2 superfamily phosphatase
MAMNRTGLVIALAVAAATGLLFGLYPRLDLAISAWFFDPLTQRFPVGRTTGGGVSWPALGRELAMGVVTALAVPAGVTLLLKLLKPGMRMLIPARAAVLLVTTLLLAPGLLTNVLLKEHWGRPRPIDVHEFAGGEAFVAWWDPRGGCLHNCSFVAGEGSGAFWALAPAALAPPQLRPLGYAAALGFGAATGALRIAFGGHFFSDVVFSGVFTFLIIWVVHGLLYRWPRTAIADAALEAAIGRRLQPIHTAFANFVSLLHALLRRINRRPRGV